MIKLFKDIPEDILQNLKEDRIHLKDCKYRVWLQITNKYKSDIIFDDMDNYTIRTEINVHSGKEYRFIIFGEFDQWEQAIEYIQKLQLTQLGNDIKDKIGQNIFISTILPCYDKNNNVIPNREIEYSSDVKKYSYSIYELEWEARRKRISNEFKNLSFHFIKWNEGTFIYESSDKLFEIELECSYHDELFATMKIDHILNISSTFKVYQKIKGERQELFKPLFYQFVE